MSEKMSECEKAFEEFEREAQAAEVLHELTPYDYFEAGWDSRIEEVGELKWENSPSAKGA